MKQKARMGNFRIFLIILLCMILFWIGMGYMSQSIVYSSAQQFFDEAVKKMEDREFTREVLDECREEAQKNGYHLETVVYAQDGHRDAKVKLFYRFKIPVIGKEQEYAIEGFAR